MLYTFTAIVYVNADCERLGGQRLPRRALVPPLRKVGDEAISDERQFGAGVADVEVAQGELADGCERAR